MSLKGHKSYKCNSIKILLDVYLFMYSFLFFFFFFFLVAYIGLKSDLSYSFTSCYNKNKKDRLTYLTRTKEKIVVPDLPKQIRVELNVNNFVKDWTCHFEFISN